MAAPTDNPLAEYDSSESCDTDGSGDYQPTPAKREQKQTGPGVTASLLFNSNVSGVLDRNKMSNREAVRLMVPIAVALGHDPSSLPLSRSTIHRMRQKTQKEFAEATLMEYKPSCPIVVHWDGKILPEIFGQGKAFQSWFQEMARKSCWVYRSWLQALESRKLRPFIAC